MAGPDQGETPIEQRVDRLEQGQQSMAEKLDTILAKLTGGSGTPPAADPADPPTGGQTPAEYAAAVRAELARADAEAAKANNDKAERETIAQRLARLEEKQPEPPQPRREKVMWGDRL